MERENPVVGQKLYSLNVGNAAGRYSTQKLTPVEVVKVGRKYFTCRPLDVDDNRHNDEQYYLDTWEQKTDYMATSRLYVDPQEWEDQKERAEIFVTARTVFSFRDVLYRKMSLDDLRAIFSIIKKYTNTEEGN